MSENIEKLREAIENVFGHDWRYDTLPVDRYRVRAALAAVEQEMAKLARSEAYLAERVEALEAQQALRAQEMAALEAERDELKKRPTPKEVTRAIWEGAPMGLDGNGIRIEVARNVDKLFDGEAHQ